ncbi:MAG TPA: hypothetical protein VFA50_02675 [Stellaceae bacterium]|nr:hypothetical protein [Stellaceae bacterium]
MQDEKFDRWIAIAGFIALAVIVSTEAYGLSRSYDAANVPDYRKPTISVLNALFDHAR